MNTSGRVTSVAVLLGSLSGCTALDPRIDMPVTTALPTIVPYVPPVNGAIFQADGPLRPLFEDRRARNVGDMLTIAINEKISASQKSTSSAGRQSDISVDVPVVNKLPGKFLQGANLGATTGNTFEGKGASANDNLFTGTITATVVEVLFNGNLRVAGEKQIGLNRNVETLRFSGVVNPITIAPNNVVSSTQVADARIDYRGRGYINEAQTMGWLSRVFLNFLPF